MTNPGSHFNRTPEPPSSHHHHRSVPSELGKFRADLPILFQKSTMLTSA